jgi:hypothetical protein
MALKKTVEDRLLSEDLITEMILTYYFHIVRLLNIIDGDMIYYSKIVTSIKGYLVKRHDILKAIIGYWKDSLNSDAGDSETFKVIDVANNNYHGLESDDDESEAEKWEVYNVGTRESKTSSMFITSRQVQDHRQVESAVRLVRF